ncbi:MAG TPA: DNA-directed RNA polymerase subunit alpha C-terminal domain-containing protein, partial [Phycisphaerae bacterium]|nr:DNA-directed RNA polymerase subunit alpha C-terminal domain-containing protein [Phycisphaerae bacterium]
IGIARFALCQYEAAINAFTNATDNKDRRYLQGECHKYLRQYDKAAEEFEKARSRGWDSNKIDLALVELQALIGRLEAADKALTKMQDKLGQTADWLYIRGLVDELMGNGERAAERYERAHALEPSHNGATFRLAYYYDLHGDEEQAIKLYKECISRPPVHANALLNLAVLYEDAGEYDKAIWAVRQVLATNPNHPRARLFLKDVVASKSMYYDEEQAKRMARRNAVLDIPVTDFELSVRARNCLKKMNIRALGDLIKTTESDLLGYKNFGETSLKEIKDMLSAKGLRLGQALEEGSEFGDIVEQPAASNEGVLATPVKQLDLSVRCSRALDVLKIATLGELVNKTEAELLACRNFGQTSLNEIRQKLTQYGLKLREAN